MGRARAVALNRAFYKKTEELCDGYTDKIDPAKKTVGIPRCLMLHRLFPLANAYFSRLGYNVLLSPDTTEEQVRLAQENARGETCHPVKLILRQAMARSRSVKPRLTSSHAELSHDHPARELRNAVAHTTIACP
ncbi:MAG: acyl-CoA dehydratase activase-related protein [Collinsella sp.]